MYKENLALNSPEGLICCKTQSNNHICFDCIMFPSKYKDSGIFGSEEN